MKTSVSASARVKTMRVRGGLFGGRKGPAARPERVPRRSFFFFPSTSTSPSLSTTLSLTRVGAWASGPGAGGENDLQGQITGELMESMRTKIQSNLDALEVRVEDQSGDGQHVCISVVAEVFQDKTSVQRQRLVYKSIWLELQSAVHAVDAMTCQTPEEAGIKAD
mmetsp:Transcript_13724/g.26327  ORF Transcript_13724/g.26327 Transcript_13724/m.26327 type:complete len:165 (-) Transcript_13724:493-987(-)